VARACSQFIAHCERRAAEATLNAEYHRAVVRLLNDLCDYCGALPVAELRKDHVQHWVESHATWRSPVTRRNAITIVLAAFNHAQQTFGIPNPLRGLKKPPHRPRLHSFSGEEEQMLYSATDQPFANFLFAAIHTGQRPFRELARLTVNDVVETERGMMWRVLSSKTKKLRKIPMRAEVAELTRRLIASRPDDAGTTVFRNAQGRPWKKVTGVHRFLRINRDLGWDGDPVRKHYSCYTCRHTFAHRMLGGYWNGGVGCSIEVLAELMGDTPKVAFDHYGREWGQHYQEPLWAAIGVADRRGLG
jgi:integrase